jgi:uncharacterized protein
MSTEPDVRRIIQEKRNLLIEPAPSSMTRRRFLTFLGAGSAALTAGSAGVLTGCAGGQEEGTRNSSSGKAARAGETDGGSQPFFRPIEASDADELVLPEGFTYDLIRSTGDPLTADGRTYGDHNDYVAYFPIDALEGGENSEDGLLWVNHEYVGPLFLSGYTDRKSETEKTPAQIATEKAAVGGSIFRVGKEDGTWAFVEDERYNRRIDATTPMDLTGPAAGSGEIKGAEEVVGTLANCGGGITPWNTVLTCEENFQYYYDERSPEGGQEEPGGSEDDAPKPRYRWLDDPDNAQPPEHYGWIVEIDPFDPESKSRKHTWLGRIRHENAAIRISGPGKIIVYTGHDQEDQCIYKFVSSGTYDPADREANFDLLTDGMLHVADLANGRWVALDYENNPIFGNNGYASQADVLVRTSEAAKLAEEEGDPPIGTPLDRCEDTEVDPETAAVYAALTTHEKHGNFYGQILRITEADDDPEATGFAFEVFATGGPQTGFASPDNLAFDRDNNLWVVTDISFSKLGDGVYSTFKNNGAFFMPRGIAGPGGDVLKFASGPIQAELTGSFFTPDGRTLFLSMQHPGEETEDADNPISTWPGGDVPKSSLVAITAFG